MTTPITYSALKAARPSAYDAAATALQPVIDGFEQATVDLKQKVYQQIDSSWSGQAADAASAKIGSVVADYQATMDYLNRFQGLLRSAYEGIADAQAYAKAAETIAAGNGWQLDESGQAHPITATAVHNRAIVQQLYQAMSNNPEYAEIQDLLSRALSTAQAVNDQISQAMSDPEQYGRGATWLADASSAQASASAMEAKLETASLIPAAGTNQTEVAAWWSALGKQSPAVQVQLIKNQPALIGSLNGLPAMVRDKANRILLTDDINHDTALQASLTAQQQKVQAEIAGLYASGQAINSLTPNLPSPQLKALTDQLNSIETRLAGVNGQLPGSCSACVMSGQVLAWRSGRLRGCLPMTVS